MASKTIEKNKTCLILTHRTELLTQAGGTLSKFNLKPNVIHSRTRNDGFYGSLYVAMTKTIMSRIRKENTSEQYIKWLNEFDLIIIDEAHLQDFNSIFEYINPDTFVIGATATPERKGKQESLDNFYQDIVSEITINELIDLGYLCKPNNFGINLDLSKVKSKCGDYDLDALGDLYNKTQLYNGVYDNYVRLTPNKKAIIFSPNIKSSLKLVEELEKKGLPIKHIDGGATDIERKSILFWFKNTPNAILSNVGILTAGFDEPTIEVVILYRATKSLSLYFQMCGRGSRRTESKTEFTILDFGNNIQRHGFWDEHIDWSLKKKEKKAGLAPVKNCKCGAILRLSIKTCPYCNYDFPPPKQKETIEVILEKLEKEDLEMYKKFLDFIKLEKLATEKGYKKGWVLHKIKNEDLQFYAKYKGYQAKWVEHQINLRESINENRE